MISDDDKNALLVEIFELTGQKVGPDDPLVAAALFYSETLRRVSLEHQAAVQALGQQIARDFSASIERSVDSLATTASSERTAAQRDFTQMLKKAQHAAHGEVPSIKRELEKFSHGLMRQIRTKASPTSEIGMSLRSLLGVIFVAACAGVVAGYFWFYQPSIEGLRRSTVLVQKVPSLDSSASDPVTGKGSVRHAK